MGIGARIADLIRRRGEKPAHVARMTGLSHATLSRLLREQRPPSLDTLHRLALYFGMSTDEFINGAQAGFHGPVAPDALIREQLATLERKLDRIGRAVARIEGRLEVALRARPLRRGR